MANRWRNNGTSGRLYFLGGSKITADRDCSHEIKKKLTPWEKSYDQSRQHRCYFVNKGPSSQGYGFSSSHVWMWELDYKESWALKNWCFWTVVLAKTLESPLDCKEIQPVHPGGKSILNIHWKDWCWSWNSNILATWCEGLTHLKRPWCWERLTAGGEGDNRGWDGWMASPTQWTWVWAALRVGDGQGSLRAAVYGVTKNWTRLSYWTELKARTIISPNVTLY